MARTLQIRKRKLKAAKEIRVLPKRRYLETRIPPIKKTITKDNIIIIETSKYWPAIRAKSVSVVRASIPPKPPNNRKMEIEEIGKNEKNESSNPINLIDLGLF